MTSKPQTITITNFGGRLTRILNGDLNSGFANFKSSFGYDPFSKPMNLTWLYQPTDIKGSSITDVILAGKVVSPVTNEQYVYAIGNSSRLYRIDPTQSATGNTPLFDSPSVIAAIGSVSGAFNYGSDIEYYLSKLHISSDSTITKVNLDGTGIASVTGATSVTGGIYHPQVQFQGKLYYGNGNNIGEIDSTGVVVNGAKLSPALPTGMYINDLDVTPNGDYMLITASYQFPYNNGALTSNPLTTARGQSYAVDSYTFYWNGSDTGITAFQALPSFPATSLSTFLDKRYYFNQDTFGTALYEGDQKILTLPNNLTPMPNASTPNGTFLTWVSPEGTGSVSSGNTSYSNTYTSLYYFGKLDDENPAGLWRLARIAPTATNTFRSPLNMMVNNFYSNVQLVAGWGKHYISTWEYNNDAETHVVHFYRFVLPPSADTSPLLGVYETQTQLFSKRIDVKQIRVYTEPTAANNGFQLDMIGSDGAVLSNGTFTYSFAAGSDETKLQGALERINFNPAAETSYALGIRVTNTGTSNMTIKKIEIDWGESGR